MNVMHPLTTTRKKQRYSQEKVGTDFTIYERVILQDKRCTFEGKTWRLSLSSLSRGEFAIRGGGLKRLAPDRIGIAAACQKRKQ